MSKESGRVNQDYLRLHNMQVEDNDRLTGS